MRSAAVAAAVEYDTPLKSRANSEPDSLTQEQELATTEDVFLGGCPVRPGLYHTGRETASVKANGHIGKEFRVLGIHSPMETAKKPRERTGNKEITLGNTVPVYARHPPARASPVLPQVKGADTTTTTKWPSTRSTD